VAQSPTVSRSAGTQNHRSATSFICAAIRSRIIHGDYEPGQRLVEDNLAQEYGVSRIPVREALRVLESEGFIRVKPYSGTFVGELSAGEANDLLEVRRALEPMAAAKAAANATPEQLAELQQIVADGLRALKEKRHDDLSELNGRFHELLAVASGNTSLAQLIGQLRDKIDWVYSVNVRRRAKDSWHEHATIVEAIAAGDAELAEDTVRRHIDEATTAYQYRAAAPTG